MNFKFFNNDDNTQGLIFRLNPIQFANTEFCFQFDDEEPTVFATGNDECRIILQPNDGGNMTFTHNERVFKLFARERINNNIA